MERANRTILNILLPYTKEDKRGDERLRVIQWSMNSSKNQTTKKYPHELLFGFTPPDILQNKVVLALHNNTTIDEEHLQRIREQAVDNIKRRRESAKQKYDARHKTPTKYEISDLVMFLLKTNQLARPNQEN